MQDTRTAFLINVDIGDGFISRVSNKSVVEKYDLLGKGLPHYVNLLSEIVEEKRTHIPPEDWKILSFCLRRLMIDYQKGELYEHLLKNYGPEVIAYSAWVQFSTYLYWRVCVKTFSDMPTAIFEEYCARHKERFKTLGPAGSKDIAQAIQARNDMYGALPPEMVKGFLLE